MRGSGKYIELWPGSFGFSCGFACGFESGRVLIGLLARKFFDYAARIGLGLSQPLGLR
jgi:hypothetical protein